MRFLADFGLIWSPSDYGYSPALVIFSHKQQIVRLALRCYRNTISHNLSTVAVVFNFYLIKVFPLSFFGYINTLTVKSCH